MILPPRQTERARVEKCPVLILGVGNILMRDEGVGVRVIEAMGERPIPPGVELFDGATAGIDLLDALADRRKVIVIDAMDGHCEPGTVLRLCPEDLTPSPGQSVSLHEVGFLETLTIAGRLGAAPEEVVIYGVQPQVVECGLDLSPEISRLVPRIIELVMADVDSGVCGSVPRQEPERESSL